MSCNTNKKETSSTVNETKTQTQPHNAIISVRPCELFTKELLASTFNIQDLSTIEYYDRRKYKTTDQCQYIWTASKSASNASQLIINITSNTHETDNPTPYSRLLAIDLEKGLIGTKQQIIKPIVIDGLGENAYFWAQPDYQDVQKIKFQVNNSYMVEVIYNSYLESAQNDIKKKLCTIGTLIQNKLK